MKQSILLFFFFAAFHAAAQFSPDNLVVFRIGNGTTPLNTSGLGNPAFLDEYTPTGTLVQSIPIPTTDAGDNMSLVTRYSLTDGLITRSADGRYILFPGYHATVGDNASSFDKIVGRISVSEDMNITTVVTPTNVISSATSDNGNNIWSVTSGSFVNYNTLGSTTETRITSSYGTGVRSVHIYDGQLYVSTANAIAAVGSGTPTTPTQPFTNLPGAISGNFYQFVMLDLDAAVPGVDVLYAADQNGTIDKYSKVAGNWVANGTISAGQYPVGLTGRVEGGAVRLFAVTNASFSSGGGTIQTLTDASGYNATLTGTLTTIATAGANTGFRGIAFTPTQFALPVKFISLSAENKGGFAEVSWTTAGAEAAVAYSVERSGNGRDFTKIGQVVSPGSEHVWQDKAPLGGNSYYRIKALEVDGSVTYSSTIKLTRNGKYGMRVVPTLVKEGLVTVQMESVPAGNYEIAIHNQAGQVVQRTAKTLANGSSVFNLALGNLNPGVYFLSVSGKIKLVEKIIVQ